MDSVLADLRFGLRQLGRAPGFALAAVLTLALGIGANTAIFSLLDQALLRALPVRNAQQLVVLHGTGKAWEGHTGSHGGGEDAYFSYPMYKDLRDRNQAFQGLIATAPADVNSMREGTAQIARAELVSGNYFEVLGVPAAVGRVLGPADDTLPGGNPVAVVSYDFWQSRLGSNPDVVGQTISINGKPFQITGVTAPRFRSAVWGETPAFFVPMSMLEQILPGRGKRLMDHTDRWMNILGRLRDGETAAQAQVALQPLWHGLRAEELRALGQEPQRFQDEFLTRSRLLLTPGAQGFSYDRDNYQTPLLVMMGMALLVLLMASVNVASLLLVRAAARVREFSLRCALGARTSRIFQQLLLEGVMIGFGGGALGMLLAPLASRALIGQLAGDQANGVFSAAIDTRLLAFNFAVALLVSIAFSIAPALQLRRPDLTAPMRQQAGTGSGAALTFRRVVVCLQIGVSVVLLVGAGLFVRTVEKLHAVDVGFSTQRLVSFGVDPQLAGYAPGAIGPLQEHALARLATLPGVQSVAATDDPELANTGKGGNVEVAGYTAAPDEDLDIEEPSVSPSFFSTLGIPLLAGRGFDQTDRLDHPRVAVVNEAFAKHFCGSAQACLGRQMAFSGGTAAKLDTQIVGVVRDTKHEDVRSEADPTAYTPLQQQLKPARTFFYLRTGNSPTQQLTAVRRAMQQLDPALALTALRTMDVQIDDSLSNERLIELLALAFGLLASLLAGIGLYGVLAYATAQRTREIGIRIALGSSREAIARSVLADVGWLAIIGIAVALPVAYAGARLLRSQLFGVSPGDPVSLLAAIVLVVFVALLAALIPARRAVSIDPVHALRME